ncbi:hypothetical protein [Metabacillus litoralis]|uniref:hypothetical protein n=1 Tax=Metabacillus litoralis TaxID=152268 RepID=UPI00203C09A6|nr:hypothetical protein [Metabacillus litoralis]MCM3411872.1 hypothetical protein [Metabacillus litoralis]
MILLISFMMVQFLQVAFPKDAEMERRIPIMEERAEQRREALKQLQKEAMCKDARFNINCD